MFIEQNQIIDIVLYAAYVCNISYRLHSQGFMNVLFIFITQVSDLHFMTVWL
jgi:hypothetical protein